MVSSILPKNEQDAIILFRDLLTFNVGNVVEWPSFIHSLGISSDEELMLMFADEIKKQANGLGISENSSIIENLYLDPILCRYAFLGS